MSERTVNLIAIAVWAACIPLVWAYSGMPLSPTTLLACAFPAGCAGFAVAGILYPFMDTSKGATGVGRHDDGNGTG